MSLPPNPLTFDSAPSEIGNAVASVSLRQLFPPWSVSKRVTILGLHSEASGVELFAAIDARSAKALIDWLNAVVLSGVDHESI